MNHAFRAGILAACAAVARPSLAEPAATAPTPTPILKSIRLSMDNHAMPDGGFAQALAQAMSTLRGGVENRVLEEAQNRTTITVINQDALAVLSLEGLIEFSKVCENIIGVLSQSGADRAMLFSLPTVRDRRAVIDAAESVTLLVYGRRWLDQQIKQAEQLPEAQRPANFESTITSAVQARDTLLPLQESRLLLLVRAELLEEELRAKALTRSIDSARAADPASSWAAAERSLLLGIASLQSSDAPAALKHLGEARAAATENGAPPEVLASIAPDLALGAVLATQSIKDTASALAALDRAESAPAFKTIEGKRELTLALVAAGTRLRLARSAEHDDARAAAETSAFAAFRSIIDSRDFAEPMAQRRALAVERLGEHVPAARSNESLPAIALVARADALIKASKHADALPLLELCESRDEGELGQLRPLARSLLGQSLARDGAAAAELARAVSILTKVAHDAPNDAEAPGAILRAAAAGERLWPLSPPGAPDSAAARAAVLGAFRLAHETTIDVPHRAALRERFVALLIDDLPALHPAYVVAQVNEAEAVAGPLKSDPAALAGARLAIARAWLVIAADAPKRAEAYADQSITPPEARRRSAASARAAIEAASLTPNAAALARPAAAVAATALLDLAEPERAWEVISAAPSLDVPSETDAEFLAAGARTLGRLERIDECAAWLERLNALAPPAARAAAASVSDSAWFQVSPLAAGFAADSKPDRVPAGAGGVLGTLRFTADWPHWTSDAERREQRRRLAWAQLLAGEAASASAIFRSLSESAAPTADLLRATGEAALAMNDDEAAFAAFKRLAADLESRKEHTRDYWHAWTRMIEILSRQNTDSSRTDTIRREAARLEALESAQRQSDCVARIRAIRDALK